MAEASARREATPDQRRQLLIRAGVAVVVVAVMLIGLSLWDRGSSREAEKTALATPPMPASGIHPIGSGASEPELVESAPAEPAPGAPAQAPEAAEETQGDAKLPWQGTSVETQPPRRPANAAPARTQTAQNESAPRLVLQTEAAPPGERPPPGKAFALQVGVFSNAANAEDLRAKLVLAGVPAQIETRVQVGPFKSRDEVAAAQTKLKALGVERSKLVLVKP